MDPNLFDMEAFVKTLSDKKFNELHRAVIYRNSYLEGLDSYERSQLDWWAQQKKKGLQKRYDVTSGLLKAIKSYRNRTRTPLKESKDICESYLKENWGINCRGEPVDE